MIGLAATGHVARVAAEVASMGAQRPGPINCDLFTTSPALRRWSVAVLSISLFWLSAAESFAAEPDPIERTALDQEVDAAVQRGITFLVSQQQPSGGWKIDSFGGEATSATSLALMALLAAGAVPNEPPYARTFHDGMEYLLKHQTDEGLLIDKHGHGPLYCHGISTLLLAEIAGMVEPAQQERCRRALEQAVLLLLQSQAVAKPNRHAGGWRYTPRSLDSDLSVTAWQLLALRGARNIGCDVPAESIDAAVAYVRQCGDRRGGYGYQPGAGTTPILTGAGLTALQVCGVEDRDELDAAAQLLAERLPQPDDGYYFYGVYYSSVGLHRFGTDVWPTAKKRLFQRLLKEQLADGSWLPEHGPERALGKTYPTSMAVLALTVEYGYLPVYQK
jgi:hypothetical protein